MFLKRLLNELKLSKKAFNMTKRQMGVSLIILLLFTLLLSLVMCIAEQRVQDDYGYLDAVLWTAVKYVEDPAEVVNPPITALGKLMGTLVGVLGIAIFAVPAGLIGSGLIGAMEEKKREDELEEIRHRMRRRFRRKKIITFSEFVDKYIHDHPNKNIPIKERYMVPRYIPLSRFRVNMGMRADDVMEVCHKFPEFRLKNLAEIGSEEEMEGSLDRFVVEAVPFNRDYGCLINNQSKVTIVCTNSWVEIAMGHFGYYLALLGGFNFIGKEREIDPDEPDSYFNFKSEPLYMAKTESELILDRKKKIISRRDYRKTREFLDKKKEMREKFEQDLRLMSAQSEWVIIIAASSTSSSNNDDIHIIDRNRKGSDLTVDDQKLFGQLCDSLKATLSNEFGYTINVPSTERYPLLKSNIAYKIRNDYKKDCNCFVVRPSSQLVNSPNELPVAYCMALQISEMLDGGRGIQPDGIADLKTTGFGYKQADYPKDFLDE